MIDKLLRIKIAQRKLIISAAEPLNFDKHSTLIIRSGSKCRLVAQGGLISC